MNPRLSEFLQQQKPVLIAPGLLLRPIPVSATTLENASHVLAASQIGLDGLKTLGVNPSFSSSLTIGVDGAISVVALAEIVQGPADPKLGVFKRVWFYLKRVFYVAKFVQDVVPVAPPVHKVFDVIGLVVTVSGELFSIKLTHSNQEVQAGATTGGT